VTQDIISSTSDVSFWEFCGYMALGAVFLGVVGESIAEFTDWPKRIGYDKTITRVSALILIAGLASEGITQVNTNTSNDELVGRQQGEIAVLHERATQAERETARIKERIADRSLTREQQMLIAAEIRPFSGMQFDLAVLSDPEPLDLLSQIEAAVLSAGWKEVDWGGPGDLVITRTGAPTVGQTMFADVSVGIDPALKGSQFEIAATALVSALNAQQVKATLGAAIPSVGYKTATIHVMIGKKRPRL